MKAEKVKERKTAADKKPAEVPAFNISKAAQTIKSLEDSIDSMGKNLSDSIKTMNESITQKVLAGLKKMGVEVSEEKNRTVKSFISQHSLQVRFYYNVSEGDSAEVEFGFADRYKVYDFDGKIRPDAKKAGLDEGSIFDIRTQGVRVDLTKENDSLDDLDYLTFCSFLGQEFKNRKNSEFIKMVEEYRFYIVSYQNEISLLNRKLSEAKALKSNHELLLLRNEIIEKKFIAPGNVILLRYKQSDFVEFKAIEIKNVGTKNVSYVECDLEIKRSYSNRNETYYLLMGSSATQTWSFDKMVDDLSKKMHSENKVEVITAADFVELEDMIKNERENICSDNPDKHYLNRSKYYKRVYEEKRGR